MGDPERWPQASGLSPEGSSIFSAAFATSVSKENEWWAKAELRAAELITSIQPNQASEERRQAVVDYVKSLIKKYVDCQVVTFGSVPLKTYLPDGDIDLTAFSHNHEAKRSWIQDVHNILRKAEHDPDSEFRVKDVQLIHAEVKIIKCFVENIMVDISFNQLGGVCTLCFLEEVDRLIGENHLFKRSIILVKAWCYYESRILGAHFGLISTYALETLVLYIFHIFHASLRGPLQVLYTFLEFFSCFDWDKYCVSLWGPIPIASLPEVAGRQFIVGENLQKLALSPRREGGELLLSEAFLDACSIAYGDLPADQDSKSNNLYLKFLNVSDPLRNRNNLGRSVNQGNFVRIRGAFSFGARTLRNILKCSEADITAELDKFFDCTLRLHGSRPRPDAAESRSSKPRASNLGHKDKAANGGSPNNDFMPRSPHFQPTKPHFLYPGWAVPSTFIKPQIARSLQEGFNYGMAHRGAPATWTWPSAPVAETNSANGGVVNGTVEKLSAVAKYHAKEVASKSGASRSASVSHGSNGSIGHSHHTQGEPSTSGTTGIATVIKGNNDLDFSCGAIDDHIHRVSGKCEEDDGLSGTSGPPSKSRDGQDSSMDLRKGNAFGSYKEAGGLSKLGSVQNGNHKTGDFIDSPSSSGYSRVESEEEREEEEFASQSSSRSEDTASEEFGTTLTPDSQNCTRETNQRIGNGLLPHSVTLPTTQSGQPPLPPLLISHQSTLAVSSLTFPECSTPPVKMRLVHPRLPPINPFPGRTSLDLPMAPLAGPSSIHLVHPSTSNGNVESSSGIESGSRTLQGDSLDSQQGHCEATLKSNCTAESGFPRPTDREQSPEIGIKEGPGVSSPVDGYRKTQYGCESQEGAEVSQTYPLPRRKGRGNHQGGAESKDLEGNVVMHGKPRRGSGRSKVGWHVDNWTGKVQGGEGFVAQDEEMSMSTYPFTALHGYPQQFAVPASGPIIYPHVLPHIHPSQSLTSGLTDATGPPYATQYPFFYSTTTGPRVLYHPMGKFQFAPATTGVSDSIPAPYCPPVPEAPPSYFHAGIPYYSIYNPGINIYKVASHAQGDAVDENMNRPETNGSVERANEKSRDGLCDNSRNEQVSAGVAQRLKAGGIPVSTGVKRDDTVVERTSDGAESSDRDSELLTSDFGHHLRSLAYGRYCQSTHSPSINYIPPPLYAAGKYAQKHRLWEGPGRPDTNGLTPAGLTPYYPVGPGSFPFIYQWGGYHYQHQFLGIRGAELSPRPRGTGTYLPNPLQRQSIKPCGTGRGGGQNGSSGHQDRHDQASDREGTHLAHGPRHRTQQNKHEMRSQTQNGANGTSVEKKTLRTERGRDPHKSQLQVVPPPVSFSHPTRPPAPATTMLPGTIPVARNMVPFADSSIGGVSPHGRRSSAPSGPPVVVVYPLLYDSSMSFPQASVEFGALGQALPSGENMNDTQNGRSSSEGSSHDQFDAAATPVSSCLPSPVAEVLPSTVTQRNVPRTYEMKEEDFPPLSFRRQQVTRSASHNDGTSSNGNGSSANPHAYVTVSSS